MNKKQLVYIVYVGSAKITFLKARLALEGHVHVEALSTRLARGFDRGIVKNLSEACETLSEAVKDVMGPKSEEILPCRLVVGNAHVATYTYQSSIYFHGNPHPITLKDVRQAIAQTRSVATIPLDELLVQAVPQEFLVNDLAGVQNPAGLEASRLGVTLKLLTLNFLDYQNLLKVCERCELEVVDVIPSILAAAHGVLTDEEKQAGVILGVVGGNAMHFACYRNSVLLEVATLPIGADCITEVIERSMNLNYQEAQKLKETFGSAIRKTHFAEELIPLPNENGQAKSHIKRKEFDAYLGKGVDRLFQEIVGKVNILREQHAPITHIVFTGGGGINSSAKCVFRIAEPKVSFNFWAS